mgnify:CR=1 FL=1
MCVSFYNKEMKEIPILFPNKEQNGHSSNLRFCSDDSNEFSHVCTHKLAIPDYRNTIVAHFHEKIGLNIFAIVAKIGQCLEVEDVVCIDDNYTAIRPDILRTPSG